MSVETDYEIQAPTIEQHFSKESVSGICNGRKVNKTTVSVTLAGFSCCALTVIVLPMLLSKVEDAEDYYGEGEQVVLNVITSAVPGVYFGLLASLTTFAGIICCQNVKKSLQKDLEKIVDFTDTIHKIV